MNGQRDPDAILATWLEEGPTRLPDATRRAIAVTTATTNQARRPFWSPWRYPFMNTYAKLAITAVIVVAVGAAGFAILGSGSSGIDGRIGPSPSSSQSPTPTGTPVAPPSPALTDTSNWSAFTSPRYGYSIGYPSSWTATPADHDSTTTKSPTGTPDSSADHFIDETGGYQVLVTAFAVDLPPGMAFDDWVTRYYTPAAGSAVPCSNPPTLQSVTVDGHPGTIAINDACGVDEAFVLVDGRVHSFGVWRENQEALFRAFLSTVRFATPSASASPRVLAADGFVYPGHYASRFDPGFSFTIDTEVEHNCAFGFTCRGSIDANLAGYLELEFGQPRISVTVVRVDKVNDPSSPGRFMDPPADLAGWIATRPGLTVVSQQAVTIGGVTGTKLDVQVGSDDVIIGPIPGVSDHPLAVGKNSATRIALVRISGHTIVILTGAEDGSVDELQPLVDSIVWR